MVHRPPRSPAVPLLGIALASAVAAAAARSGQRWVRRRRAAADPIRARRHDLYHHARAAGPGAGVFDPPSRKRD